ncbi:MAG: TM1812 family CRISPR-associated protein, partial [Chloroflexi bacterium]|nr:TM1812 family CRISPR-associated protein [Chloroflexota bacterium]
MLCSVGLSAYRDTSWELDRRVTGTPFAVVALARIRKLAGWHVKVLATQEARGGEGYGQLQAALGSVGLSVEPVIIPTGTTREEIFQIVEKVIDCVPPRSRVILDITQALRHLPFTLFTALVYLTVYSGIELEGVYSGAFEAPGEHKPIVDLTSLFELSSWFHALQSVQDTGSVKAALRMFNLENSRLGRERGGENPLSKFKRPLPS